MATFTTTFFGATASRTINVTANNDTVVATVNVAAWTITGTSNCSVTPTSGAAGTSFTVSNFTRAATAGSYSVNISRPGAAQETPTLSGTIGATTGTISITGMDGNNAFEAGSTATVSWTSNDNNFNGGYNSTGSVRFSPGSGSNTLSGTSGSFTTTCASSDAADGVWETNNFTLKFSNSSSTQLAASNSVVLFASANAGTATVTKTSDDLATGNFTLSLSTTAGSPGVINYRFLNGAVVLQAFGTTNTVTLGPEYRTVTITGQVREEISTNNLGSPVYDTSFSSDTITVPLIATDTTFTASSPTISWDAATFTTTLTDVQIGDEVRAVLTSNTGVIFENFTTVTDTTFDLVCNNATVNSTNLPIGSATSVTLEVRRPEAAGGDDNTVTGPTFNVTRNYRTGPFANVYVTTPTGGSTTIGAQAYAAYDIGQSEQVRVTGSGVISGASYIGTIISGTTQGGATTGTVYNQVASGTEPDAATTAGGCAFSQLPTPGNSCSYRITCIIPTSLGGDGSTPQACYDVAIVTPGQETEWTITRSYYVQVDGTFDKSTSATLVSASDYRVGVSSTSETISYTNGGSTSEYRLQKLIGISPIGGVVGSVSSGTSGTFSISNANLPPNPGDAQGYTIEYRVAPVDDGDGVWYSNIGSYSFYFQREQLIQPTLGTLQAYANSSSLSQIVPTVERTNNCGNGLIEYAWSSTNSTPTNWTSLGALGFVAGFDIAAGGIARSASNLYMGVREKSPIDGTTTTATYVSNTNGPWVNEVNTLASRLITMTYDGNDYEPSQGQQVVIEATELTKNVTVSGSLSSSLAKTAYTETQVAPDTAGFSITSSVTNYSSFALRTDAAATLDGVAQSANYLVGSDTTNSAGNSTFTIDNPTEIVDAGNTLGYTLYEYVFTARGGDGVEVATTPAIDNNMVIRRRGVIDDTITVTVPKKNLAPADGSQTITIADGGNGTEYRIRVTGYTDANSDGSPPGIGTTVGTPASITGNGSIVLDASDLPEEGDTVSYKVQFRESGTSDAYTDCSGTNSTFTIGKIQNFTITDGAPNTNRQTNTEYDSNTITVDGISGTETVTVRRNSDNGLVTWALSEVNGSGTFSQDDKSITNGQSLVIRFKTSTLEDTSRTIRVTFTGSGHTELWTLKTGGDTGTGTGGGGSGTGATYGLIINNSSGNNLIDGNSRVTRQVASNDQSPLDLNGDGTTSSAQTVTGLTNSVDWTVVVTATKAPTSGEQAEKFSVNKGTGSFTITNNTADDGSGDPNNSRRFFYWRVFKNG